MARFNYDEGMLRAGQKEAAHELVLYEFSSTKETPDMPKRKTKQQIADEIGVSRKTLHEWDTMDTNFIAYKNKVASDFLNSQLPLVYGMLVKGVKGGSMRAIEIFMKRIGDLDTRSEITINDGANGGQTFDEREAQLRERLKQLEVEKVEKKAEKE